MTFRRSLCCEELKHRAAFPPPALRWKELHHQALPSTWASKTDQKLQFYQRFCIEAIEAAAWSHWRCILLDLNAVLKCQQEGSRRHRLCHVSLIFRNSTKIQLNRFDFAFFLLHISLSMLISVHCRFYGKVLIISHLMAAMASNLSTSTKQHHFPSTSQLTFQPGCHRYLPAERAHVLAVSGVTYHLRWRELATWPCDDVRKQPGTTNS